MMRLMVVRDLFLFHVLFLFNCQNIIAICKLALAMVMFNLALTYPAQAEEVAPIYKWSDPYGLVHYSHQKPKGLNFQLQEIELGASRAIAQNPDKEPVTKKNDSHSENFYQLTNEAGQKFNRPSPAKSSSSHFSRSEPTAYRKIVKLRPKPAQKAKNKRNKTRVRLISTNNPRHPNYGR